MAYSCGGISTIYGCIQVDAPAIGLPNYFSNLAPQHNGGNKFLGYVSGLVGKGGKLSSLATLNSVYETLWMQCEGRTTGLWNRTIDKTLSLKIPVDGIRKFYATTKIMPMWRASHRHTSNLYLRAQLTAYNKSGVLIYDSGLAYHYGPNRPEYVASNGNGPAWEPTTTQDVGEIRLRIISYTTSNNWHEPGDRGHPPLSWTPTINVGKYRVTNIASLYPHWGRHTGGSGGYHVEYHHTQRYNK